jgi:phage terminase small subunit
MPLSARHAQFVEELLVDDNAAAAARRCNYSEKTANKIGWNLRHRADIAEAYEARVAERIERLRVTVDVVLDELDMIAFAKILPVVRLPNGREVYDGSGVSRDKASALATKAAALVNTGKHRGMFKEKLDLNHGGAVNIVLRGDEALL